MANLAMGATPLYFSSPYFRTLTFGSTATIPPEGTASKKTAPSVFKKDVLQQLKEIEQKN